jgi:hypothetical protein
MEELSASLSVLVVPDHTSRIGLSGRVFGEIMPHAAEHSRGLLAESDH